MTLFAAASLTDVLSELAGRFREPVRTVFAGSGEVVRQVLRGAPADLVALADPLWMDRLAAAGRIRVPSRVVLATNALVVIAPADRAPMEFAWRGRIAIGEPDSVPAGRYARDMMRSMGVWDAAQPRIVTAADVRAVRSFVARGEVDLGVVYVSDTLGFGDVRVVASPPPAVQPDIVYPAALTTGGQAAAADMMTFLRSAEAQAVFARHGFRAGR